MEIQNQPISNVQWVNVENLSANDYNPNVVFTQEMKLLLFSIKNNGWIQPILCTQDYQIIDGYHRATLAKTHSDITIDGKVPCVIMQLSEPERMLLTIRINRAKGSHVAVKMSDIVHTLVNTFGYTVGKVAEGIGANKDEVELLLMDNVFQAKGINEETKYSKAWVPTKPAVNNTKAKAKTSATRKSKAPASKKK